MQLLRSITLCLAVLSISGCKATTQPFYMSHNAAAKAETQPEQFTQSQPANAESTDTPSIADPVAESETLTEDHHSPLIENVNHIQPIEYSLAEELDAIQPFAEDIDAGPSFLEEIEASEFSSDQSNFLSEAGIHYSRPSRLNNVWNDHRNFYSRDSMLYLATGLGAGSIIANTNMDQELHESIQENFSEGTKDFFHSFKEFGNGAYTIPVFAGAWAAGVVFDESHMANWSGEWGGRSLRSLLVGAPPMLLFQKITGGSRPGEIADDSRWGFFEDNNGVSGHSFMGALPFINAAKMTDNFWLKSSFYVGSTLVPISRVTDGDHYTSQAILGWWFAYLAAVAVDDTQNTDRNWHISPLINEDHQGGVFEYWF